MKVIYNMEDGEVIALGDVVPEDNQQSIELSEDKISRPITGTVVDDVESQSKTVDNLEKIKQKKKKELKEKAYEFLKPSDWYVIRKQEEGIPIPDVVADYRSDVRATEDNTTTSIENATTADEVRSINPDWPSEPEV